MQQKSGMSRGRKCANLGKRERRPTALFAEAFGLNWLSAVSFLHNECINLAHCGTKPFKK